MIPELITSLADVAVLQAAARRLTTRCGDGEMVWHRWGDGEPVVLLHGGAGSWTHWVRNIAALVAAGRCVLAADLPGFGDSAAPPSGRDADALPPPVEQGLRELLGTAPCDLVGFSFGGMVASLLAAQQPNRVRRLVLVGSPALSSEPMIRLGLRSWNHLPPGLQRDALHRFNLGRLMLARAASIDELALRLHDSNIVRDRMTRRRLASTDIVLRTLPQIGCPVWGIWGAEDLLYRGRIDVVEAGLRQAANFQGLTLIADSGHWVQYEDAGRFNAALVTALAGPPQAEAPSTAAPAPKA